MEENRTLAPSRAAPDWLKVAPGRLNDLFFMLQL